MPRGHGGSTQLISPAEMEIGRGENRVPPPQATIAAPDEPSITGKGKAKPRNKQSLDYVLKSGLAGGLAACTVNSSKRLSHLEWLADLVRVG